MSYFYLALIALAATINSSAQLLLKKGSLVVSELLSRPEPMPPVTKAIKVIFNPFLDAAVVLLVIGMVLWIKIISRVELSRAYPINIALTVLATSVISTFLFQESMGWLKGAGIGLILVGVWAVING